MITYRLEKEKEVALYFAKILEDAKAAALIETGEVKTPEEARHLSQFFWHAVSKSAEIKKTSETWPFDSDGEFWTEKLYNSFGGYLERAGYEDVWDDEIDKA